MIEATVISYLASALSVPVSAELPATLPASFAVVEKTGGSEANHIRDATIAVQSYAPTLFEAAQLNEAVLAAMKGLVTLPSVSRCTLNTSYNFTDPSTKQYRYQAVFDITHY